MEIENELKQLLSSLGFVETQGFYCGSWKNYAVTLWKFTAKTWFAAFAVRLSGNTGALRKQLRKQVKAHLNEPGLKIGGVESISKTKVLFSFSFSKDDAVSARLKERMDFFANALRENGVLPADTCAITGALSPDSLCFVQTADGFSYQPVCASAVRTQNADVQQKVEENENNGSYDTGMIGAILGMLVGVLVNLLTIIFLKRVIALVFALVPAASLFGYKLFKGKMSKGALVIVLVLCLIAVLLMPYLEIVYYLVHDYGQQLSESLVVGLALYIDGFTDLLSEIGQLLLFMALGVWVAWSYLRGQINSNKIGAAQTRQETLRPNPNYQPQAAPVAEPAAPESEQFSE